MEILGLIIKVSTATLFGVEILSVLNRAKSYHHKREPLLFMLILVLLCAKTVFPLLPYFREFSSLLLIFALKSYLTGIIRYKRERIYNFAFLGFVLMLLSVIPAGAYDTLANKLFFATGCVVLSFPVFVLMYRLFQKVGKRNLFIILVISAVSFAVSGFELFFPLWPASPYALNDLVMLALSGALGYLIFEEEYFIVSSLQGLSARLTEEEKRSREVSRRLMSTEESLIAQDRLISVGTLAGGLTHEFKNILSLISSCAQFGLMTETVEKKNQSLTLIQEHIEQSMGTVIRVLDQIRSQKNIAPKEIDLAEFMTHFSRIVRANYRASNIEIALSMVSRFRATAKRDDVEQILLNLIRNAASALLSKKDTGERKIVLTLKEEDGQGIIEVRDNAGGVSEEQAMHLFQFHAESTASTGLGLYLTRLLAEQNGLSLRYSLLDGESCFGIVFPAQVMAEIPPLTDEPRPVF